MLVEQPLGNLGANIDPSTAPENIDWLDLTWAQCLMRAIRGQTRAGVEVRLIARLGVRFRHADLLRLASDGAPAIAINVVPCELLFASPSSADLMAQLCYELGNLHLPLQIESQQVLTPADGPTQAVLDRLGVPYESRVQRFHPTCTSLMPVALSPSFRITPAGSGLGI